MAKQLTPERAAWHEVRLALIAVRDDLTHADGNLPFYRALLEDGMPSRAERERLLAERVGDTATV